MTTFEERYTAWLDGKLMGPELAAFERELPDREAAEAEKRDLGKLRLLLRRHGDPRCCGRRLPFRKQRLPQV